MTPEWYSDFLHDSAARWGLPVAPGRPLIDDRTDPYPQPQVVEALTWRGPKPWRWATIRLVMLAGQWSFCFDSQDADGGSHFGPWRKFCDPYPDRAAALAAAIAGIEQRARPSDALRAWLRTLQPEQLTLFEVGHVQTS